MKNVSFAYLLTLLMILFGSTAFLSCEEDEDNGEQNEPEAQIASFAIVNAGANGDVTVQGEIAGKDITVDSVPYQTDVTSLVTEIEVSEGAEVTPSSGDTLDFTDPRNFVVTNGDLQNTYTVTVEKGEPTSPIVTDITVVSAFTGNEYDTEVSFENNMITVTYNTLQADTVILSNVAVAPEGATYNTSSGTDTLDLSEDQTLTVSYAGESSEFTITANVTQAGFDPTTAETLMDKSAASGLVPAVIADDKSRNATFNGQYVFVPSRKDGNHVYYWERGASVDEAQELALGDVVSGGSFAVSDVQTVGDAIYVSNMVMEADQVFKVYRWDNVDDDTPEVVIEYTITDPVSPAVSVRLGDALSVVGDPGADGYIMASNFPFNNQNNQLYVWKADGGAMPDEPEIWDVQTANETNIGQYGRVNGIPGMDDHFMLTGAEMGITIIDNTGDVVHELVPEHPIQGRAYDPHIFEYNGGRYLSYTVNREWEENGAFYKILNITAGADAVEGLKGLTDANFKANTVYEKNFSAAADVWVSARNDVAFDENGDPMVFAFTVQNGFIVERFTK